MNTSPLLLARSQEATPPSADMILLLDDMISLLVLGFETFRLSSRLEELESG